MKEIEVDINTNLLIRFLKFRHSSKFRVFNVCPTPLGEWEMPTDTCSLARAVMWHTFKLLLNVMAVLLIAMGILVSITGFILVPMEFIQHGHIPKHPSAVIAIGLVLWITVISTSIAVVGGLVVMKSIDRWGEYKERREERISAPKKSKPYGFMKLVGALYTSIKDKTCFRIKYVRGN